MGSCEAEIKPRQILVIITIFFVFPSLKIERYEPILPAFISPDSISTLVKWSKQSKILVHEAFLVFFCSLNIILISKLKIVLKKKRKKGLTVLKSPQKIKKKYSTNISAGVYASSYIQYFFSLSEKSHE